MKTLGTYGVSSAMQKKLSDFLLEIARARMRALLVDYDSTLSPFDIDNHHAAQNSGLIPLLQRLREETGTRVVIVTGRPAASVARRLRLSDVEIWGCRGLERLKSDGSFDTPEVSIRSLQAIADATDFLLNAGLGEFAERKFASIAIHWRGKEELAGHLTRRVLHAWSVVKGCSGVRLVPFEGGLEITVAARSKSDVVETILSEVGAGAAVAYLGDDPTAEDAFGALHGLGLNVLVRSEYRTTLADVWVRPPGGVTSFLGAWMVACDASG